MRHLSSLALVSMVLVLAACSRETSALDSFRDLVQVSAAATDASSEPYRNKHHDKWAKRKFRVTDLTYDVRKTESLVSPLVGHVTFTLASTQTALFPDKEAAQASSEFDSQGSVYKVELSYAHQDGKWRTTTGRYSVPALLDNSFDLTPTEVRSEPHAIPNAALLFWLR